MIKKTFLLLMASIICIGAFAQKDYIVVKKFTRSNEVNQADLDKVHSAVASAIVGSQRFNVIDENNMTTIAGDASKYALEANVSKFTTISSVSDGKTVYKGVIYYSITVVNLEDNKTVATANYGGTSLLSEDSREEAEDAIISDIAKNIEDFLIKEFPLIGEIYGEDFVVDGNRLKECYITLGSIHGVKQDDRFTVHEVVTRVGKDIESKPLGRLKIKEVYEDMSLCEITKGEKDTKKAMDRYLENRLNDPNTKKLRIKSCGGILDEINIDKFIKF